MENSGKISQRQLMALVLVCVSGPVIRLVPKMSVRLGGHAAWLSPILAVGPMLLVWWLMRVIENSRLENEGLTGVFCRAVTPFAGKPLAAIYALCFVGYCGFILHTVGERMVGALYPNGTMGPFIVISLLAAVIAARGRIASLGRMAEISVIVLLGSFIFVLAFSVGDLNFKNLLPVTYYDAGDILKGSVPIAELLTLPVLFLFLGKELKKEPKSGEVVVKWLFYIIIMIFIIITLVLAVMGETLASRAQNPFYLMVRNIGYMYVIQRIDAVVVAFWALVDFVYSSTLLYMAADIFADVFGKGQRKNIVLPCAALALIIAFILPQDLFEFQKYSTVLVPAINAVLAAGLTPIIIIIGKLTKRI